MPDYICIGTTGGGPYFCIGLSNNPAERAKQIAAAEADAAANGLETKILHS